MSAPKIAPATRARLGAAVAAMRVQPLGAGVPGEASVWLHHRGWTSDLHVEYLRVRSGSQWSRYRWHDPVTDAVQRSWAGAVRVQFARDDELAQRRRELRAYAGETTQVVLDAAQADGSRVWCAGATHWSSATLVVCAGELAARCLRNARDVAWRALDRCERWWGHHQWPVAVNDLDWVNWRSVANASIANKDDMLAAAAVGLMRGGSFGTIGGFDFMPDVATRADRWLLAALIDAGYAKMSPLCWRFQRERTWEWDGN